MIDLRIPTITQEEANKDVVEFIDSHFEFIKTFIHKKNTALGSHINTRTADIDYMLVYRFLNTAIDQLKSLETSFSTPVFQKYHRSTKEIMDTYIKFKEYNVSADSIFSTKYIGVKSSFIQELDNMTLSCQERLSVYEGSQRSSEMQLKTFREKGVSKDDVKYKKANANMVDSMHNAGLIQDTLESLTQQKKAFIDMTKELFTTHFNENMNKVNTDMRKLINIKIHLLNKMIWVMAKQYLSIMEFFTSIVKSKPSIETYMRYYLNSAQSNVLNKTEKQKLMLYINKLQELETD